jgi:hypothetical protein
MAIAGGGWARNYLGDRPAPVTVSDVDLSPDGSKFASSRNDLGGKASVRFPPGATDQYCKRDTLLNPLGPPAKVVVRNSCGRCVPTA